jgi:putative addiction module killer protein
VAEVEEEFSDIDLTKPLTDCSQWATLFMIEVRQTEIFARWFLRLRDLRARARIQARIDRLELGNAGDTRPVGDGVSEMRIDYGPGYRIYFIQRGSELIILLAGGDKSSQSKDITKALLLASEL